VSDPITSPLEAAPVLDELGFYTLAGQPDSSRDLVQEVIDGEALGLGTAFISERYNKKEAATLSGAAGAVSQRIRIQTAATNHNTRHPLVTAKSFLTLDALSGGRTILGSQSPARCVTCEARAHRCASRGCPATRTAGNAGPGYGDAPRQQERTDLIDDSDTLTEQSIADAVQRLKVELIGCLDCDEFHGRALDSLGEGFRIGSRSSIPSNTGARISPASGGRRGQAFGVWG